MSLKLFRSTGYHSILSPGETRVAPHPGWAVTVVSLWTGIACNTWLWQSLAQGGEGLPAALGATVVVGGWTGFILSLFGWRRTFKPAAVFLLLLAALLASGAWLHDIGPRVLVDERLRMSTLLPTWASLFGWQVPLVLVLLGGVPVLWLLNLQVRRLPGGQQWRTNLIGMVVGGLTASLGLALLGLAVGSAG